MPTPVKKKVKLPAKLVIPTDDEIHEMIADLRDSEFKDTSELSLIRDYIQGRHDLSFLSPKIIKRLGKALVENFSDNICRQIINESVGRVSVKSMTCKNNPQVGAFIKNFILQYKIASRAENIHNKSFGDGNHVVFLGFNSDLNRMRFTSLNWWDGKKGAFVAYNEYDEEIFAVNEFPKKGASQVNIRVVFLPDRIITFEGSNTSGWKNVDLVKWVKTDGSPLHLPIIHFKNNAKGEHRIYGSSELTKGIIVMQNHLNDLHFSMIGCTKMTGHRMYWGTGISDEAPSNLSDSGSLPEERQGISIDPEEGKMLLASNADAKFGSFEVGDSRSIESIFKIKTQRLGQLSATPTHYISGGDWPSGDALIRAELPAISKARSQIEVLRDCWTTTIHRAIEIYNVYNQNGESLPETIEEAQINVNFFDPERRDILALSTVVNNMRGLLSTEESLNLLGYSPDEVSFIVAALNKQLDMAATNVPGKNTDTIPGDPNSEIKGVKTPNV